MEAQAHSEARSADANDTELIVASLLGASMCAGCIAAKTGIPLRRTQAVLERVAGSVRLTWRQSRCDACLQPQTVFRLA